MSGWRRRGGWREGQVSGGSRFPRDRHGPRAGCGRRCGGAGSEKAAAYRLGLSHSTVRHHLASVRSKVGATTTAQLVWILGPRLPEPYRALTDGGTGTLPVQDLRQVASARPEESQRPGG